MASVFISVSLTALSSLSLKVKSIEDLEKPDDLDFETVAFEESAVDTEVAIALSHQRQNILVGFQGTNEVGDFAANGDYFGLGLVHPGDWFLDHNIRDYIRAIELSVKGYEFANRV
eukprot:CAMPEP_0194050968 /NCGR_PEP_ID=MMETSP0009_2-20130614/37937_1 /TAXON_ID=210454 /ORGANISM="Grammatophora oceanica, Strain CCMP 410" /LENGTH=115 /DNA_ID=CAMNT_0038697849 /DNA_START=279 /DNA_END=625 /DNA_ORIENTATION=+